MSNLGYFLAISAGLLWGTIGISVFKLNQLGLSVYEISFLRTFFTFVIGMIYLFIINKKKSSKGENKFFMTKKIFFYIALSGIISQGGLNIAYSNSMVRTGTITSVMLLSTGPMFTMILSRFLFKEKLGFLKIVSLIIVFSGAFLLITNGDLSLLNFDYLGVIFGLLSGLCYGLFPIFNKKVLDYMEPVKATIYSFGVASLFLMFLIDFSILEKLLDIRVLGLSLFYAVVATLIPYCIYAKAMLYIPISIVSIISLLEVPATAVIGVLILKENLSEIQLFGIVITCLGIIISKIKINESSLKKLDNFFHLTEYKRKRRFK